MSLGPGNGRDRSLHQLHQVEGGAGGFSSTWTPGRGPEEQPALEKIEAILNSEPLAEVQKKNLKLKGGRQCPEMANIYSEEVKSGPEMANTEESATIMTWHEGSNTEEGLDPVNTEVGQTSGYFC